MNNRSRFSTSIFSNTPVVSATLCALLGLSGCYAGGDAVDSEVADSGDAGEDVDEPNADGPSLRGERITGIPVGAGGLTYEGIEGNERDSFGPSAYAVDERDFNWVADGPGNKILVVDDDGQTVDEYLLDGLVQRLEDMAVTSTHVYLLDTGLAQPKVSRIGRNDIQPTAWESFDLPPDIDDARRVTGLRSDRDGTVHLELGFGAQVRELFDASGEFVDQGTATALHRVGEHEVEFVGYSGAPEDDESTGAVIVDGTEVATITTAGMLGGFSFLGATADNTGFWIRVQDVTVVDEAFVVRDFAYRMAITGEIREVIEMPMADQSVYVHNRLAFDTTGAIRSLSTQPEEVVLAFPMRSDKTAAATLPPGATKHVATTAAGKQRGGLTTTPDHSAATQCRTGGEIMARAYAYANYTATYGPQHLDASCSGRTRPGHATWSTVKGAIYRYAGYQTLQAYDAAVQSGKVIGDVKQADGVAGCANGVDCSGFVSQVWGSSYHSTHWMHQITTVIDRSQLIPGDALHKIGHVRLVEKNLGSEGVMVVESTTGSYDRVIARWMSWGSNNAYKAVRYHQHCGYYGEPPMPEPEPEPEPEPVDPTTHVIFDVSGYLPQGSAYTPVPAERLVDTRDTQPLGHEQSLSLDVTGPTGVDANQIDAVILNIAAINPSENGFLAAYADNLEYPGTSNINFAPGGATAGLVVAKPGPNGKVKIRHVGDSTDVAVDFVGWFPAASNLTPVTPTRVIDTRETSKVTETLDIQLTGIGGIPSENVGAVVVNLAVVAPESYGYAQLYERGADKPVTSNLNFNTGEVRANLVIVPVSADGKARLWTLTPANYVVDVFGYFPENGDLKNITPVRVHDTRDDDKPLAAGATLKIDVTGNGVPATAEAVLGNLTVAQPTNWGYLLVHPTGSEAPSTSNLNFGPGMTVANAVIAEVGNGGQISVFAHVNK